jgi:hypothetical protein
MQPQDLDKFNQAVSLAQSGQKAVAHAQLGELARLYPNDPNVWLWLAFTSSDGAVAWAALERVAQLDPANASLAGARQWAQHQFGAVAATPPQLAYNPTPVPAYNEVRPTFSERAHQPNAIPFQPQSEMSYAAMRESALPMPESKKESSGLLKTLAIIGAVFVGLMVAIIGLILLLPSANNQATSLPIFPGATKVDFNSSYKATFTEGFKSSVPTARKFEIDGYLIKPADRQRVLDFYTAELLKSGWRVPKGGNALNITSAGGSMKIFVKGDNRAAAVILTPGTTEIKRVLNEPDKYQSGDLLLMLMDVEANAGSIEED